MKISTAERVETAVTGETAAIAERVKTTAEVRLTGRARSVADAHRTEFTFEDGTLRALLEAFFAAYDVHNLVIAEREADATTRGWVQVDRSPGTWRRSPEGEQTQPYVRVLVNSVFSKNPDGFDARLEDGDRVTLMESSLYCV